MLAVVRRSLSALSFLLALTVTTAGVLFACERSERPPGSPADVAPCPADAGTALPRELACCLIQARTGEEAQICLDKADGGH